MGPFIKSLEVWLENNKDLPEHSKYNEILESLKLNKEIEGLSLYIGEHIVGKLDAVEKQTGKGLIELLKTKYGRTRQEELEELRKVVKARGTNMQKDFITKYRELKVESHRGAQAACADTLYMGTRSKSRQRYEEQRIR